jgi:hypothetical protein
MVRGVSTGGNKKTLGKMKQAIDKAIDDKKKEPIGTKEAEEKVAADLNEAAKEAAGKQGAAKRRDVDTSQNRR